MFFILITLLIQCSANNELFLQISQHLNIQHSLKITNNQNEKIIFLKAMSANFIFGSTCNVENVENVVKRNTALKTLVAFNEANLQEPIRQLQCNVFWLMERDKTTEERVAPINTYIPFSCNFWLAQNKSIHGKEMIDLHTIYQTREENEQIINFYGSYSNSIGLQTFLDIPTTSRRNLFGTHLILFAGDSDICQFQVFCTHFRVLQGISMSLNFKLKQINSTEMKVIYKGKVDLTGVAASIYNYPPKDLIAPTLKGWINMYIKDTFGSHGDEWLAFSRPFSTGVWISVGAWLIVATIFVTVLSYFLLGHNKALIVDSAFAVLDAICCQGGSVTAGRNESRSSVLMPRLLGQVLVPAYSAAVISFLTIHISSLPFEDLSGFWKDGTYRWSCLSIDIFSNNYFRGSASTELQEVAKLQQTEEETPNSYAEGIQRICKDKKFAMLVHDTIIEKEWSPCKIVRIPKHIVATMGGMPLSHQSPYREAFKWALFKMHSTGSIDRMIKQLTWAPVLLQEPKFYPIDEPQITVPFIILTAGFIVCSIIFFTEKCCNTRRQRNGIHRKPRKINFRHI